MHSEFNAQSSEPFALRKKRNDKHMLAIPSLATNGFNIWWQKTAAQNIAMVTEASELVREHRLGRSANQLPAQQAH